MYASTKKTDFLRQKSIGPVVALLIATACGCSSLTQPIDGIPAHRLPPQFFSPPKNDLVPIDVSLLSQEPPRNYVLDSGDILGVYVEGVFPFSPPDQPPALPPVNFPDADSTLPPSLGFPIAVQDDGKIALPLVQPLAVKGLTMEQVRNLIRKAYIDEDILKPEKATPIVTLIKEREYNVIVVRQDSSFGVNGSGGSGSGGSGGGGYIRSSDQSASSGLVKLPAYQNDILHALMETGGLPGLNAKNEIKVLRASLADKRKRADFVRSYYANLHLNPCDPCVCPPPLPDDPSILRVPMRLPPGVLPAIRPQDVILEEGDVVYIENRDAEVFYTGGLLPGGEHLIPRDYDLDVIGAMALAGGKIAGSTQGGGGGGGGGLARSIGGVPPGRLYILRKTRCNGQISIEVDLAKAINDPRSRPFVQPGDILILQYKPCEEVLNFGIGTFFTYGIQRLLQSSR